jgi:hypothetical protein
MSTLHPELYISRRGKLAEWLCVHLLLYKIYRDMIYTYYILNCKMFLAFIVFAYKFRYIKISYNLEQIST